MTDKNSDSKQNAEGNRNPDGMQKAKKKFSRALSFDVKALTAAMKSDNNDTPKTGGSPKQKKSVGEQKRLSSSSSDVEEEIQPMNFNIQYLGYVELKSPGFNEIIETVNKLYHHAKPYLKSLDKSLLTLTRDGITIKQYGEIKKDGITENPVHSIPQHGETTEMENLYKPRRILYCGVDKQHQRIFSFNYQFGARAENIHLHVLVCKTKDDARVVAKYLAQLFKRISKDIHRKEKEDKRQHQEGLTKLKTKSNQNIHTYSNMNYPTSPSSRTSVGSVGSKEGSCSGTCGSGEWLPERVELSIA